MTNYHKENTHTSRPENKAFEQNRIQFPKKQKVNLGIIIKTDRVDPLFSYILYLRIPLKLKFLFDLPDQYLWCFSVHLGTCTEKRNIWLYWHTSSWLMSTREAPPSCFSSHIINCLFWVYSVPNFFFIFVIHVDNFTV